MLYYMVWGIDIDADSPAEAAKLAREIQLDPQNAATHFSVTDADGNTTEVNVGEVL